MPINAPHLDPTHHWEVGGRDDQLKVVSDRRNVFARIGSWITGSSSPQKVFTVFTRAMDAAPPQLDQIKELYKFKEDIQIEYPRSYSSTFFGRIADSIWRGGNLQAKEAAINATYSRLDKLFFAISGTYDELGVGSSDQYAYRAQLDSVYGELTSITPDLIKLEEVLRSKNLPVNEIGAWMKQFADLDYPGAQFFLAHVLNNEETSKGYGLGTDPRQAMEYGKKWLEYQGNDPSILLNRALLSQQMGEERSVIQRLLTGVITQSDANDTLKAEAFLLRGLLKLNHPDPDSPSTDLLSGWQDLIQAADKGNEKAIQEIRDREIGALKERHLFPTHAWGYPFTELNKLEVEQLHARIWTYTVEKEQDYALALGLRAEIYLEKPLDPEKMRGWQDLAEAAELGSKEAMDSILRRSVEAVMQKESSPIPETGNKAFTEAYSFKQKTEIDRLSMQLWLIASTHTKKSSDKVSFLEKAAEFGSLEACRQIRALHEEKKYQHLTIDYVAASLKKVVNKQPMDSSDYKNALNDLYQIALGWEQSQPKKAAALLLDLVEHNHEPSRLRLAEMGLSNRPNLTVRVPLGHTPQAVHNYLIGKMLDEGILLERNEEKADLFFEKAAEIPVAAFLTASLYNRDAHKEKAVELLLPIVDDPLVGQDATQLLKALFPLTEPPAEEYSIFSNARTALYHGGLKIWTTRSRDVFQETLDPIPIITSPNWLKTKIQDPDTDVAVVAYIMKRLMDVINPKLLSEGRETLDGERKQLLDDLLNYLHYYSKMSSVTGMDAQKLAVAWAGPLFSEPPTEEQIEQLKDWILNPAI